MVGAYCRTNSRKEAIKISRSILDYLGVNGIKEHYRISQLSEFERKKIELASALATSPKMILLDELLAGCSKSELEEMIKLIVRINEEMKITFLIIEHILHVIMNICNKIIVLDYGEVLETGTPKQVSQSKKVIAAYLGSDYDVAESV